MQEEGRCVKRDLSPGVFYSITVQKHHLCRSVWIYEMKQNKGYFLLLWTARMVSFTTSGVFPWACSLPKNKFHSRHPVTVTAMSHLSFFPFCFANNMRKWIHDARYSGLSLSLCMSTHLGRRNSWNSHLFTIHPTLLTVVRRMAC